MDYLEVKERLEASKLELMNRMQDTHLLEDEKENIQKFIENYDYIIELTDMNHFERGKVVH
ncbi:DUF3896 family protein [Cytobacillus oceanisediminis]|uniref:Uncharacterized protein DUF3896 n=1 Tax=Cytobacillus oceanisediminis TaxID=665099 RepID=A0A562K6W5_9BACI|nr:DUF3896 family protein [Cytobacillus oceanisediminis]TWH91179.1 uncharacterized protein DUF3896 [Cytobacillus oceanisediminis]